MNYTVITIVILEIFINYNTKSTFWAELSSTPSNKTSLLPEWENKMKAIVNESINEKVTSLAGVPSWMFVLLQNVLNKTGKKYF